jgi:hypothetical protein
VTRFKVGCEIGRWLPDWIWSWTLEVRWAGVVCVLRFKIGCDRVREGRGWLGFEDEDGGRRERDVVGWRLKMKMLGEGCGWLWSSRWRWIDFVTDVKLWIVSWGSDSGARRKTAGAGVWMLGLRKVTRFFFVFIVPLKPNRFGLVGVFPVSGFWNRTEPKIFAKNLIGFFFRFGFFGYFFFGLFGFSVFFSSLVNIQNNFLGITSYHISLKEALIIIDDIFDSTVYEPWEYEILRENELLKHMKSPWISILINLIWIKHRFQEICICSSWHFLDIFKDIINIGQWFLLSDLEPKSIYHSKPVLENLFKRTLTS